MRTLESLEMEITTTVDEILARRGSLAPVIGELERLQFTVAKHLEMALREQLDRARARHAAAFERRCA